MSAVTGTTLSTVGGEEVGMANSWNVPTDVVLASLVWLIVGARLRAAAGHPARMAELAECTRVMRIHRAALRVVIDNPAVPEPLLRPAFTVSETLSERSGTMTLARWIIDSGPSEHGLDNSPAAATLREVEATHPTVARLFERYIETGFLAAILRRPDGHGKDMATGFGAAVC